MNNLDNFLKVKPTGLSLKPGRILISVPFFQDPFFNRAVVLLTDYSPLSCAGLVLNKQSMNPVSDFAPDIKVEDEIYIGGPVLARHVFCIHNYSGGNKMVELLPGTYLGYDNMLLSLAELNTVKTLKYKFFLGYSGWTPGQLEEELESKMWVIANPASKLILDTNAEDIWHEAVMRLGKDYAHWLDMPEDITEN